MCSEESKSNRCISDEHILLPFLDLQEGLSSKNNGSEKPGTERGGGSYFREQGSLILRLTVVTDLNSLSHL